MIKLGLKGRSWLKSLHIALASIWLGTGVSMLIIGLVKGSTPNGDELYAVNATIKLLDDYIIIPSAIGTLLTGALISWWTNWGFVKYKWVIVKWAVGLAQMLFGTLFLGPWTNGATAIVKAERAMALHNNLYLYYREMNLYCGSIQLALLIVLVFISVIKPWGKRIKN